MAFFCEQFYLLVRSGADLNEGVYIMADEITDPYTKKILNQVYEELEQFKPLSAALEATGAFPEFMTNTIKLGERAGKTEEALSGLFRHYKREEEFTQNLIGVVSYPCVLFIIVSLILLFLVIKIFPMFSDIYYQISDSTESGYFLENGIRLGWVFACLIWLMMIICVVLSILLRSKRNAAAVISRIRLFDRSGVVICIGKCNFLLGTSLMLSTGMEITESLEIIETLIESRIVREMTVKCRELCESGVTFGTAIEEAGILTGLEAQLIRVGIRNGSIDASIRGIADIYGNMVNEKINSFSEKLETILVVFLALMIGLMLIAILLPMANIISGI